MRIHCLQHSERVRALNVQAWADERGVALDVIRVDLATSLPDPASAERVIVLGGEMNTDDVETHPWLALEREWLGQVVERPTTRVFGICLGSQLLAEVLGGRVTRSQQREVGWATVRATDGVERSRVFSALPDSFDAFQWHGDTWELPLEARLMVTGDACMNQAFEWDGRVWGVQFHPEFTYERTVELAATTSDDLNVGGAVQTPQQFLARPERFDVLREMLDQLLDRAMLDRGVESVLAPNIVQRRQQ